MKLLYKATSTPEEWAAFLAARREYNARPEVKERRRLRDNTDEKRAERLAYHRTAEAKAKAKKRHRDRAMTDPNYLKKRAAYGRLLRTGFTPEMISAALLRQGNGCAICRRSFDEQPMRADHCHATGKPRGLLCHNCNIIEGMLQSTGLDVMEFAHRMVAYLGRL